MKNVFALSYRIRYLVPFRFGDAEEPARDILRFLDGKKDEFGHRWEQTSVRQGEQDVYRYILDSFEGNGINVEGNIGVHYAYRENTETGPVLKLFYKLKGCSEYLPFSIPEAGVFLFHSSIGFFWYEVILPEGDDKNPLSLEEIIEFQARFKELSYRSNQELFFDAFQNPFSMGDHVARILRSIDTGIRFFADRRNTVETADAPKYVPDKAIPFNFFSFEEGMEEKELDRFSYYLSNGYRLTHKFPNDFEARSCHPFEGAVWTAGEEGGGYYAIADRNNRPFFQSGLKQKVMTDYFLIFILALQEAYAALRFSEQIAMRLSADSGLYLTENALASEGELRRTRQTIQRLSAEIQVFLAKNVHSSVSHIHHQNEFYRYVRKMLHSRENLTELAKGLRALKELLPASESDMPDQSTYREWISDLIKQKQALEAEMYRDELTGLYNFKAKTHYANQILDEAQQKNLDMFICVVDLNRLKYINDNFGHEAGNQAICEIANAMKNAAPKDAKCFRTGGDEFLILGAVENGEIAVQDFLRDMESETKRIEEQVKTPYQIYASYGPIFVPGRMITDLEPYVKRSDEEMYWMKIRLKARRED